MPLVKLKSKAALLNEETPASVLYSIILSIFGSIFHSWDLQTIWMEVQDEFQVDLPDSNKDKLAASLGLLTSNEFYENFQAFEAIGKGLNGQEANFDWITPLTPEEAAWAVAEANVLDSTPEDFSEEIKAYTRELLREGGLIKSPPQLSFCAISSVYPAEQFVPLELADKIELGQKIKLKKIQAYVALQKSRIAESLGACFD